MDDGKATPSRADRDAAHVALYGRPRDLRPGSPGEGSIVSRWLVGDTLSAKERQAVEPIAAVAQAIATARAEGVREGMERAVLPPEPTEPAKPGEVGLLRAQLQRHEEALRKLCGGGYFDNSMRYENALKALDGPTSSKQPADGHSQGSTPAKPDTPA